MKNAKLNGTKNAKLIGLAAVAALSLSFVGCGHTLSGDKQDVQTNAAKVNTAAKHVGNEVKDIPKDEDSPMAVTPEVKTAIVRDPVLNDPRNVINVDSHDNVTHLTGHVQNDGLKQRATD